MRLLHPGAERRIEQFLIPSCAFIGAIGLFLFARHAWNAGAPNTEPTGIPVRWAIPTIYAPQALIDFAKAHPEISSNADLVRLIREAKLDVWFATVLRSHKSDGRFADVPRCHRLGERPEDFLNERAALLTLAGSPPESDSLDWTDAKVEIIEEAMMKLEPKEGLRQLLGR
jgi:hypothetical protein